MARDKRYPETSDDEFLRFHLFTVPLRRLQGEGIEEISRDLHAKQQAHLVAGAAAL